MENVKDKQWKKGKKKKKHERREHERGNDEWAEEDEGWINYELLTFARSFTCRMN